jgi:hypothetical protein
MLLPAKPRTYSCTFFVEKNGVFYSFFKNIIKVVASESAQATAASGDICSTCRAELHFEVLKKDFKTWSYTHVLVPATSTINSTSTIHAAPARSLS